MDFRFSIGHYRSGIADFGFSILDFRLCVLDWWFSIFGFGFSIWILNLESEIWDWSFELSTFQLGSNAMDHNTEAVSKVTVPWILECKLRGERIACLTAYDYPTARLVDEAGIELLNPCFIHQTRRGIVVGR